MKSKEVAFYEYSALCYKTISLYLELNSASAVFSSLHSICWIAYACRIKHWFAYKERSLGAHILIFVFDGIDYFAEDTLAIKVQMMLDFSKIKNDNVYVLIFIKSNSNCNEIYNTF